MHILSDHNRSEFLSCPQLIRFDYAKGLEFEPTLLIKGSTLLLKYIAVGAHMQLALSRLGDRLFYGLKVYDDAEKPGVLWSVLERDGEKSALSALASGAQCQVFLFNELAVNVAWSAFTLDVPGAELSALIEGAKTGAADHKAAHDEASGIFDQLFGEARSAPGLLTIDVPGIADWQPVHNIYITNQLSRSLINLFDNNEGNQHEQLALWLTDNLHPNGSYSSPQVQSGKQTRELTDVLLTYENGSFFIEAKALAILARERLPDRKKLAADMRKDIANAERQLRGGIRKLKAGVPIVTPAGNISVERTKPAHAIILVPDMDLIEQREAYGLKFIKDFMRATGGFLHLLDISELLRVVQAAEMISARSAKITPMMAFDSYLLERVKKTVDAGTLCIEMLIRFEDEVAK